MPMTRPHSVNTTVDGSAGQVSTGSSEHRAIPAHSPKAPASIDASIDKVRRECNPRSGT
jgi:hypothetical protein